MSQTSFVPAVAALLFVVLAVLAATRGAPIASRIAWIVPAVLSAGFLALSVEAVVAEGPTGFWTEHTRNLWGNQIWCDLLLAIGTAWALLVPRARACGMRWPLWLVAILVTGSIGLLAMVARVLFLESRAVGAPERARTAGAMRAAHGS